MLEHRNTLSPEAIKALKFEDSLEEDVQLRVKSSETNEATLNGNHGNDNGVAAPANKVNDGLTMASKVPTPRNTQSAIPTIDHCILTQNDDDNVSHALTSIEKHLHLFEKNIEHYDQQQQQPEGSSSNDDYKKELKKSKRYGETENLLGSGRSDMISGTDFHYLAGQNDFDDPATDSGSDFERGAIGRNSFGAYSKNTANTLNKPKIARTASDTKNSDFLTIRANYSKQNQKAKLNDDNQKKDLLFQNKAAATATTLKSFINNNTTNNSSQITNTAASSFLNSANNNENNNRDSVSLNKTASSNAASSASSGTSTASMAPATFFNIDKSPKPPSSTLTASTLASEKRKEENLKRFEAYLKQTKAAKSQSNAAATAPAPIQVPSPIQIPNKANTITQRSIIPSNAAPLLNPSPAAAAAYSAGVAQAAQQLQSALNAENRRQMIAPMAPIPNSVVAPNGTFIDSRVQVTSFPYLFQFIRLQTHSHL